MFSFEKEEACHDGPCGTHVIKAHLGTRLGPRSRDLPCWEGRCQPEGGDFPPSGACAQPLVPCSCLSVLGVRAPLGDGQRALASLNACRHIS